MNKGVKHKEQFQSKFVLQTYFSQHLPYPTSESAQAEVNTSFPVILQSSHIPFLP